MKSIFKRLIVFLCLICVICVPVCTLTGCNKADNIQHNIRQDSDNFETYRRVTVINLRSDKVLLTVEGYISIKDSATNEIAIIINTAPNKYRLVSLSVFSINRFPYGSLMKVTVKLSCCNPPFPSAMVVMV